MGIQCLQGPGETVTSSKLEKTEQSCIALKGTWFLLYFWGFPQTKRGWVRPIRHPSVAVRKEVVLRPEKRHLTVLAQTPQYEKEQEGSRASKVPEMALSAQVWMWVGIACQEGLASRVRSSYVPLLLGWRKWGQAGWEDAGCLLGACAG